jgi:hypothetical protein
MIAALSPPAFMNSPAIRKKGTASSGKLSAPRRSAGEDLAVEGRQSAGGRQKLISATPQTSSA